jgi:type II secretory pathway component PulJ
VPWLWLPGGFLQVHISYLEIYNEVGYDLLDPTREVQAMEDLPQVRLQAVQCSATGPYSSLLQNNTDVPVGSSAKGYAGQQQNRSSAKRILTERLKCVMAD